MLYEVCNTFRERHTYVIPVLHNTQKVVRQRTTKKLFVSPFIDMKAEYHFCIVPPSDQVNIIIRQENTDGLLLAAAFSGYRSELTRLELLKCLGQFPLLCIKIFTGIHWEALKMWIKGFPVYSRSPAKTAVGSSIGHPTQ